MTFTPGESANLPIILKECQKQGLTLPYFKEDIAYILATVKLETGWNTLQEIGGRNQAIKLGYGGGANYFGRGYVQLTHIGNYQKFQDLTGKPLVSNPDLVLDPELAAFILVYGMINGSFTGRKLEHFAYNYSENEPEVIDGLAKAGDRAINFIPARSIVNGNDKAVLIANYATEYLKRIVRGEFDKYFQIELKPQLSTVISTKPEIWTKEIPKTPSRTFENEYHQNLYNDQNINLTLTDLEDRDREVSELKAQNQNLQNQITEIRVNSRLDFDQFSKQQDELNAKIKYLEEKKPNPNPQFSNSNLENQPNFAQNPILNNENVQQNTTKNPTILENPQISGKSYLSVWQGLLSKYIPIITFILSLLVTSDLSQIEKATTPQSLIIAASGIGFSILSEINRTKSFQKTLNLQKEYVKN